jgi:hypothetical protein
MRHLRSDYDAIQPWPVKRPHIGKDASGKTHECKAEDAAPIIPDDEPVFLLRANDPVAAHTVRDWANRAQSHGADQHLVSRVLAWADEMDEYRVKHAADKQFPDTPKEVLR